MNREQAEKFVPLLQAYSKGKQIQFYDGGHWNDISYPDFNYQPELHRVKPDPKKVPLTEKDVPIGSLVRDPLNISSKFAVVGWAPNGITFNQAFYTFEHLMTSGHEIQRPDGSWKPFYRIVG